MCVFLDAVVYVCVFLFFFPFSSFPLSILFSGVALGNLATPIR
jgi:hypothetical protein